MDTMKMSKLRVLWVSFLPLLVIVLFSAVTVVRLIKKSQAGAIDSWQMGFYLSLLVCLVLLAVVIGVAYFQIVRHRETLYWILSRQQSKIDGILSAEKGISEGALDSPSPNDASGGAKKWPWGSHHTEHLGHLEAAAKQFWVNYDPDDPSTAPTIEMVSFWLKSTRGLSGDKARAIASILRADGLPHGPRR